MMIYLGYLDGLDLFGGLDCFVQINLQLLVPMVIIFNTITRDKRIQYKLSFL